MGEVNAVSVLCIDYVHDGLQVPCSFVVVIISKIRPLPVRNTTVNQTENDVQTPILHLANCQSQTTYLESISDNHLPQFLKDCFERELFQHQQYLFCGLL